MPGERGDGTPTGVVFREARGADLPRVIALLREGSAGEPAPLGLAAAERQVEAMASAGATRLFVGEIGEQTVACYQITLIFGLSLDAGCRAQLEGVRVAGDHRGRGIGAELVADAEGRARAAGAELIQLMSNRSREAAHRFYARLGYRPSHAGFKKRLSDPD